jgi:hypothetical protein
MKNIHVLPTDKPSRVYKHLGRELKHTVRYFEQKGLLCINQNIYITSEEKPKAGDWSMYENKIHKCIENIVGDEFKKIILTTDQDLIKDSVQAIDDIFLEWFVENPSCEYVEVVDDVKYFNIDELRERHLKGLPHLYSESIGYKIIIPKEEPKQETLEEAAERFYPLSKGGSMWMPSADDCNKANKQEGFIEGAKSDAARDYWFEQFKKKGGDK